MAAGDYAKTTYINGSPPALSAANLNNNENKTAEIDSLIASHLADLVTHPDYGATTGSTNTYALTLDPAPTSYIEGMGVVVKISADNTGASTINVNSLGAKTIKAPDGADLSAGDLKTDSIYALRYNGVNFILQGKGGVVLTGDATDYDVVLGKTYYNTDAKTKRTGTKDLTNLTAGNIKKDVVIAGVTGSFDNLDITAGDNLLYSDNNAKTTSETTYTKVREVQIKRRGTVRVKFTLAGDDTYYAYAKIYINGVAVGTERSKREYSFVTFSEDFTVAYNDLIQIYLKCQSSMGTARQTGVSLYTAESPVTVNL